MSGTKGRGSGGRLLVLMAVPVVACGQAGDGRPPSRPRPSSPGNVVVYNATSEPLRYWTWLVDAPRGRLQHDLEPGGCHFYRVAQDFACQYGSSTGWMTLKRNSLYEYR